MTPALLVIAFIAGFIGLMIAAYRNTDCGMSLWNGRTSNGEGKGNPKWTLER